MAVPLIVYMAMLEQQRQIAAGTASPALISIVNQAAQNVTNVAVAQALGGAPKKHGIGGTIANVLTDANKLVVGIDKKINPLRPVVEKLNKSLITNVTKVAPQAGRFAKWATNAGMNKPVSVGVGVLAAWGAWSAIGAMGGGGGGAAMTASEAATTAVGGGGITVGEVITTASTYAGYAGTAVKAVQTVTGKPGAGKASSGSVVPPQGSQLPPPAPTAQRPSIRETVSVIGIGLTVLSLLKS